MNTNEQNEMLRQLPRGRILGIDYGSRRIGLAMSDPSQSLSSTLETVIKRGDEHIRRILELLSEKDIVAVVVGMPYNMNGRIGERGREVMTFVEKLEKRTELPILTWDERWSTVSAEKSLREQGESPSRHRKRIDQVAAAFILQSFLDRLSHIRREQAAASTTGNDEIE